MRELSELENTEKFQNFTINETVDFLDAEYRWRKENIKDYDAEAGKQEFTEVFNRKMRKNGLDFRDVKVRMPELPKRTGDEQADVQALEDWENVVLPKIEDSKGGFLVDDQFKERARSLVTQNIKEIKNLDFDVSKVDKFALSNLKYVLPGAIDQGKRFAQSAELQFKQIFDRDADLLHTVQRKYATHPFFDKTLGGEVASGLGSMPEGVATYVATARTAEMLAKTFGGIPGKVVGGLIGVGVPISINVARRMNQAYTTTTSLTGDPERGEKSAKNIWTVGAGVFDFVGDRLLAGIGGLASSPFKKFFPDVEVNKIKKIAQKIKSSDTPLQKLEYLKKTPVTLAKAAILSNASEIPTELGSDLLATMANDEEFRDEKLQDYKDNFGRTALVTAIVGGIGGAAIDLASGEKTRIKGGDVIGTAIRKGLKDKDIMNDDFTFKTTAEIEAKIAEVDGKVARDVIDNGTVGKTNDELKQASDALREFNTASESEATLDQLEDIATAEIQPSKVDAEEQVDNATESDEGVVLPVDRPENTEQDSSTIQTEVSEVSDVKEETQVQKISDDFKGDALWSNQDQDVPVKIEGVLGEQDGVRYFKSVDEKGNITGVPETQLTPAQQEAQTQQESTQEVTSNQEAQTQQESTQEVTPKQEAQTQQDFESRVESIIDDKAKLVDNDKAEIKQALKDVDLSDPEQSQEASDLVNRIEKTNSAGEIKSLVKKFKKKQDDRSGKSLDNLVQNPKVKFEQKDLDQVQRLTEENNLTPEQRNEVVEAKLRNPDKEIPASLENGEVPTRKQKPEIKTEMGSVNRVTDPVKLQNEAPANLLAEDGDNANFYEANSPETRTAVEVAKSLVPNVNVLFSDSVKNHGYYPGQNTVVINPTLKHTSVLHAVVHETVHALETENPKLHKDIINALDKRDLKDRVTPDGYMSFLDVSKQYQKDEYYQEYMADVIARAYQDAETLGLFKERLGDVKLFQKFTTFLEPTVRRVLMKLLDIKRVAFDKKDATTIKDKETLERLQGVNRKHFKGLQGSFQAAHLLHEVLHRNNAVARPGRDSWYVDPLIKEELKQVTQLARDADSPAPVVDGVGMIQADDPISYVKDTLLPNEAELKEAEGAKGEPLTEKETEEITVKPSKSLTKTRELKDYVVDFKSLFASSQKAFKKDSLFGKFDEGKMTKDRIYELISLMSNPDNTPRLNKIVEQIKAENFGAEDKHIMTIVQVYVTSKFAGLPHGERLELTMALQKSSIAIYDKDSAESDFYKMIRRSSQALHILSRGSYEGLYEGLDSLVMPDNHKILTVNLKILSDALGEKVTKSVYKTLDEGVDSIDSLFKKTADSVKFDNNSLFYDIWKTNTKDYSAKSSEIIEILNEFAPKNMALSKNQEGQIGKAIAKLQKLIVTTTSLQGFASSEEIKTANDNISKLLTEITNLNWEIEVGEAKNKKEISKIRKRLKEIEVKVEDNSFKFEEIVRDRDKGGEPRTHLFDWFGEKLRTDATFRYSNKIEGQRATIKRWLSDESDTSLKKALETYEGDKNLDVLEAVLMKRFVTKAKANAVRKAKKLANRNIHEKLSFDTFYKAYMLGMTDGTITLANVLGNAMGSEFSFSARTLDDLGKEIDKLTNLREKGARSRSIETKIIQNIDRILKRDIKSSRTPWFRMFVSHTTLSLYSSISTMSMLPLFTNISLQIENKIEDLNIERIYGKNKINIFDNIKNNLSLGKALVYGFNDGGYSYAPDDTEILSDHNTDNRVSQLTELKDRSSINLKSDSLIDKSVGVAQRLGAVGMLPGHIMNSITQGFSLHTKATKNETALNVYVRDGLISKKDMDRLRLLNKAKMEAKYRTEIDTMNISEPEKAVWAISFYHEQMFRDLANDYNIEGAENALLHTQYRVEMAEGSNRNVVGYATNVARLMANGVNAVTEVKPEDSVLKKSGKYTLLLLRPLMPMISSASNALDLLLLQLPFFSPNQIRKKLSQKDRSKYNEIEKVQEILTKGVVANREAKNLQFAFYGASVAYLVASNWEVSGEDEEDEKLPFLEVTLTRPIDQGEANNFDTNYKEWHVYFNFGKGNRLDIDVGRGVFPKFLAPLFVSEKLKRILFAATKGKTTKERFSYLGSEVVSTISQFGIEYGLPAGETMMSIYSDIKSEEPRKFEKLFRRYISNISPVSGAARDVDTILSGGRQSYSTQNDYMSSIPIVRLMRGDDVSKADYRNAYNYKVSEQNWQSMIKDLRFPVKFGNIINDNLGEHSDTYKIMNNFEYKTSTRRDFAKFTTDKSKFAGAFDDQAWSEFIKKTDDYIKNKTNGKVRSTTPSESYTVYSDHWMNTFYSAAKRDYNKKFKLKGLSQKVSLKDLKEIKEKARRDRSGNYITLPFRQISNEKVVNELAGKIYTEFAKEAGNKTNKRFNMTKIRSAAIEREAQVSIDL